MIVIATIESESQEKSNPIHEEFVVSTQLVTERAISPEVRKGQTATRERPPS
jgi:hypothetical protein